MNPEAQVILAQAIEADIQNQLSGNHLEIAERWDDVYGELLPIEDEMDNPTYRIAMRFWECWGDSACHDWKYYPPLKESDWPVLAAEVAGALRGNTSISNPLLVDHFTPKPSTGIFSRLVNWLKYP